MLKSVEHVYHCNILERESRGHHGEDIGFGSMIFSMCILSIYSGFSPNNISELDKVVLVALTWKNLIITCYILRAPFLIFWNSPPYFVGLVSVGDLVLLLEIEWE